MQEVLGSCRYRHVHDEYVSALGEINELGIGAGLIRAEHDGNTARLHAIGERRERAMGNTKRGDGQAILVEYSGGFRFSGIGDADLKTYPARRGRRRRGSRSIGGCYTARIRPGMVAAALSNCFAAR